MKRNVLNKLLLLRLVELSKTISSYRKITQLVYIMQVEGRKEKRATFNYEFVKWHYEPYSSELEKDLQQLDLEELLVMDEFLELTEKGNQLTDKMADMFKNEKIDSFFTFFSYVHGNETLYDTSVYINEKYQIAKYPTDSIISYIEEHGEKRKSIDVLKEKIGKTFEEIEHEEQEYLQKAKELFKNNKK